MFAAHEGYVEIVKFLESVGPGSSAEALRDAAGVGDIDMMTKLLDMNTDRSECSRNGWSDCPYGSIHVWPCRCSALAVESRC